MDNNTDSLHSHLKDLPTSIPQEGSRPFSLPPLRIELDAEDSASSIAPSALSPTSQSKESREDKATGKKGLFAFMRRPDAPTTLAPPPAAEKAKEKDLKPTPKPEDFPVSRVRTADEIRAAYGFPKKQSQQTGDASSAAAIARDKLLERGEKLQDIQDASEDLASGAADFASLAAELAKKAERKWW